MKPTPLEILESIDMLRILENGYDIKLVKKRPKGNWLNNCKEFFQELLSAQLYQD